MDNLVNRRDFLKLGGMSLAGLLLPGLSDFRDLNPGQQGRVLENPVNGYDTPSLMGKKVRQYWKDMLVPISEVTIGDEQPAYNRVWYKIGDECYVHSGVIQPVRTDINQPAASLPAKGALAEVTVPYTDAHRGASRSFPVGYRYYFETTHWVIGIVTNNLGEVWYHIQEDKWDEEYYVRATHMRIVPPEDFSPLSPNVPLAGKRLEILTQEQAVVAYEWEQPVFMTRAATGARFSNGNFETPPGRHFTTHKRPSRHMAAGNLAFNGYDLPGVPWITYFTPTGISFHGTYWHNDFGKKRSHGCINLTPKVAKWVYRWTLPAVPVGTQEVFENYGTIVDVIS